ncbi:outer membrane beta-barrel protein [Mucilaginibacter ginsenosidivorax]|uniref:TonB-dependent receptor n=1 Tax=Mucilaginibacter ginsenosidivorax TaxID=862126 RepID=A0A5B8W4S8_9SPHI|nr:outer membrane beta-barrel protein [Mucilaginibacter ginsenosidivorax]QEC77985.1 TonB-dependent receptor [Mucilaginibacter ginsenosidivorax]
MYKILPLTVLLLFAGVLSRAQNKGTIKGKLIDSLDKKTVEFATIAVLDTRDTTSTLVAYTLSDKEGSFSLHNMPAGVPLKVLITFVAYQPYRKLFTLSKGEVLNLGAISMRPRQLKEVVIKGERMPIVIRKDTIEFDAEAFKTRPNAVVEDLLKKLPGLEVASDGTITVMGKNVTKILVDGREFFVNDPRIASKNLDADMIAKVQVYDDRENDPDHVVPAAQLNKIINLKFKKILKKSLFGKVYGGAGTQDHYQAGGLINLFRDTLQVSLLGVSNNLNSTGFDFNDLYTMGGVNRGGVAFSQGGFGFGRVPAGRQTTTSGGVNINTDYGKKLKVNLSYLYNHNSTAFNTVTNRQQFLADTIATTRSASDNLNTTGKHSLSASVRWKPDQATEVKYDPVINIAQNNSTTGYSSNSFSNFINPINKAVNSNNSSGNNFRFEHALSYNRQLKKQGASVNIEQNLQFNPSRGNGFDNQQLTSYITSFPSYTFMRQDINNNRDNDARIKASYRYPINQKLVIDVSAGLDYSNQLNKVSTYNYNPATGRYDSLLLVQSSDLTRNKWVQNLTPGISYHFPKNITITAHLSAMLQEVNNVFNRNSPDINQHITNLLPSAELSVDNFSAGYSQSVQLPNIGDMIPYTVVFSPLFSVTGNPDLKPTTRDNFNINFNKYNFQNGIIFYISASASFEKNSIFRERTLDAQLVETSTPINRNGRYNYGFSGRFSKRFAKRKDLQFNATSNLTISKNHDFYVLNHQDGYQDSYSINITERFSVNWKDIIEINPEYTVSNVHTVYSGVNFNNQNYIMHNANAHFNVYWPKRMNLEGSYTYLYNPLVPAGFQKNSHLLSLSLARGFLKKDRGEIKLSCYDIFNQNISTTRSVNENSITDVQSQIIKRYFMLTLQFKFNKSVTK